ncbi:MAG: DegT/DnrJ/EryC1/StrS family aminotransferase [Polyangiaceae bacterium]
MIFRVPLCDLAPQHDAIAFETSEAIKRVVSSQRFILGAEVSAFEEEFSEKIGIPFTVGVASGSDALALALLAVGVVPGDGVITTPYTFVATGSAIARVGAVPIFVDVVPGGVQIDAGAVSHALESLDVKIAAVIGVHLFGQFGDVAALAEVAKEHGVPLVEDAAQAFGATYGGKSAGAFGAAACYSFFPSKTLGAWGDGGAVVTRDPLVAQRVRSLRAHGVDPETQMYAGAGDNSRLDALQAAILRVKLRHVASWISGRRALADAYRRHFSDAAADIVHPAEAALERATFNPLVMRARARDELVAHLRIRNIEARAYYSRLLSEEPRFASAISFPTPHAADAAKTRIALPLYWGMTEERVASVVEAVKSFYAR